MNFPQVVGVIFLFWYIGVHDENGSEIYRRDLSPGELEPLSLQ
jgi:hypothetical protein